MVNITTFIYEEAQYCVSTNKYNIVAIDNINTAVNFLPNFREMLRVFAVLVPPKAGLN
ncbi:MAG: hypothetical protein JSS63_11655 [Bacteroidetes bacterium]|nr:hypothetical protein [Bacteroidota bacterium]